MSQQIERVSELFAFDCDVVDYKRTTKGEAEEEEEVKGGIIMYPFCWRLTNLFFELPMNYKYNSIF